MKRVSLLSTATLLTFSLLGAYNVKSEPVEAKIEILLTPTVTTSPEPEIKIEYAPILTPEPITQEPKRPEIPNLAIDNKLLDYMWDKCKDSDFAYTAFLAIAAKESEMGKKKISPRNKNGSIDYGIMQINSSMVKPLSEMANIKSPNPLNDYQSVDMAIELLKYEREYWRDRGLSEDDLFKATIITYHLGRPSAIDHIRKHGLNHTYLDEVRAYKAKFEQSEVEE